jgi:hypothetical protein
VYFVVIWSVFRVLVHCIKKNLATPDLAWIDFFSLSHTFDSVKSYLAWVCSF